MIGKVLLGLFWIAVLVALWGRNPDWDWLLWLGAAVFVVHLFEVALFTQRLGARLADRKYHQLMVLVFGVVHWRQVARQSRDATP